MEELESLVIARTVVESLGLTCGETSQLGGGASSMAWHVMTGQDAGVVVRLGTPRPGKVTRFEVDASIRERLQHLGVSTAEPLATSGEYPHIAAPTAWSVDRFVDGEPLVRGEIARSVCEDLAAMLHALHGLPCSGWDALEDRRGMLRGSATTAWSVGRRFQDPWPLSGCGLGDHALARSDAALRGRVAAFEEEMVAGPRSRHGVVHCDLHEKQFRVQDGRLLALIDFGEAMVGEIAWDFASFAYFHGWERANWLLEAYEADGRKRARLAKRSMQLAIPLAMHQASRAERLKRGARMQRAREFLGLTIARMRELRA